MTTQPIPGPFPFIVEERCDRDRRVRLDQFLDSIAPIDENDGRAMARACGLLQDTPINASQRQALIEVVRSNVARFSLNSICIVWSPSECTYVSTNGPDVSGDEVPDYDVDDPRDWDDHPFRLVDCRVIPLDDDEGSVSHISLRLIGADYVEVSTASPCHVASLEDEGPFGSPHPYDRFCDADGVFRVPARFRGVEITGYNETFPTLYGPVQPDGSVVRVVPRWPHHVWQVCREISGDTLTEEQLKAAWAAVAPTSDDTNYVGVLLAA